MRARKREKKRAASAARFFSIFETHFISSILRVAEKVADSTL